MDIRIGLSLFWGRSWPWGRRNTKQTAAHPTAGFSLTLLLITPNMWLSFINMSQPNFPTRVYRNTGLFRTKILIKYQWIKPRNSRSWRLTTTQDMFLWNPKVHYRCHNSLLMVPIINQLHPAYTLTLSIIFPFMLCTPIRLSFRFSN